MMGKTGSKIAGRIRSLYRKHRAPVSALLAAALIAALYSRIGCPLRYLTGIPCPGCGMTRAALALLRLDFADAFSWHPMIFAIVPYALVTGILLLTKKTSLHRLLPSAIVLAGCMVIVYVIRMILYFPGSGPMAPDPDSLAAAAYRIILRLWRYFAVPVLSAAG